MKRSKLKYLALHITDGEHTSVTDDANGNYFLLSNKNIVDSNIVITNADRRINQQTLDKLNKRTKLDIGDVVISTVGSIGKTAIIKEKPNYDFQRSVGIIKCNEEQIIPEYLLYYLNLPSVQKRLIKLSKGAIQKCLFINDLEELLIDHPETIEEQKKIVSSLIEIDQQIQRNNNMVHKLQVLAQTTYSRWFNQFEFPNEDGLPYKSNGGKMVWNDELKREIPEAWQIKSIGDLLTEENKSKVQVGEAKTNNGVFPFFTSGEEILLYKDYFVNGPHCYLNTGGNADVKFFDGKASYSTDTWCISFGEYAYFINELLQFIKPQIDKLYFSGSGLKHLQKESFKQLKLFIPDEKTLEKYNAIVSGCYQQIANIYIENNRLQSLKNSILPLLINGQLKM